MKELTLRDEIALRFVMSLIENNPIGHSVDGIIYKSFAHADMFIAFAIRKSQSQS